MSRPQIVNLTLEDLGTDALPIEKYIDALEAERDKAFAKGKQAFGFQQRAEKEAAELRLQRDTLAAQLDAVFGAVLRPFVETFSDTEAMAEARRIAMSDPQDILARRDARVKAEALEALSQQLSLNAENARENHYHWSADAMQDASDEALQEAVKCRQQAEGGGDE